MARGRTTARHRASALALLVLLPSLGACTDTVRSDLSEEQADTLLLALDDGAIGASKERGRAGRYEVRVARADVARALRVARDSGALQARPAGFAEVYGEPALVPTPDEERSRRAFATAGELARSIEALPGVLRARVHLTPPEPRAALDAAPGAWRASLLVQRPAGSPAVDETTLRRLLTGALEPLPAERIEIVQTESAARRGPEHARIGPFTVAKRDAPALRAALAGALALNTLLATLLIVVVARRRTRSTAA